MKTASSGKKTWRLIAVSLIYLGTFLTILWLAYTGNLPRFLGYIPYFDKIGHVVLYAVAAYLGHRAFRYRSLQWSRWTVPLFPALFGLFTLSEETIQHFSPNRTLDGIDLIASFAGIFLGWWLAEKSRHAQ